MQRSRLMLGAVALAGACAGGSAASVGPVFVDYGSLGYFSTPSLLVGEVEVVADHSPMSTTVHLDDLNGLGVTGGESDLSVDTNEWIRFEFVNGPAQNVSYSVTGAHNYNGQGASGESWIEAFDADGNLIGAVAASGVGVKDVSGSFGDAPLSAVRIRANEDGVRISSIAFTDTISVTSATFIGIGSSEAPVVQTQRVRITAHAGERVRVTPVGLGVHGGTSSIRVDGSESLLFRFDGILAESVSYWVVSSYDQDGSAPSGESTVEAYDADGASLGLAPISGTGSHDVSALFGNVPISAFRVRADVDGVRIGSISFTPCPPAPPCPGDVDDNGLVNVLDLLGVLSGWGTCE